MPTLGAAVLSNVTTAKKAELAALATRLDRAARKSTGATEAVVDERALLNVGLDLAVTVAGYAAYPELIIGAFTEALATASCYPTAEALFPVIANGGDGSSGGSTKGNRFTDATEVQAAVAELTKAMNEAGAGKRDMVFRIELAGHGFTLIVRGSGDTASAEVELIETIANDALIMPSLERPAFALSTVVTALTETVDDGIDVRKRGAAAMGWDAADFWLAEKKDNDPVFPQIEFRWWSGSLRPDAAQLWAAKFAERLTVIEGLATQLEKGA